MEINANLVKELREKTGCGFMDCKKALAESEGDSEKAIDYLRKKGLSQADKRSGRATSQGLIHSYIHLGGKLGVLLELNCETDFVARNEIFRELANDIALHIAASAPLVVNEDDISIEFKAKEKEIFMEQARATGKPDGVLEKIVEGKLSKRLKEVCLLSQPFVKNPDLTVEEHLKGHIAKIGENIRVKRFTRFQLGAE